VLQSCTVTSPVSNTIRVLCDFLGASQKISVNVTCTSCEGIQTPITITGNTPLDISDLLPENYTVEIIAVHTNNNKLENNSIIRAILVSTGTLYNLGSFVATINSLYEA